MNSLNERELDSIEIEAGKVVDHAITQGKNKKVFPPYFQLDAKAKDMLVRLIVMDGVEHAFGNSTTNDIQSTVKMIESFLYGYGIALDMLPNFEPR